MLRCDRWHNMTKTYKHDNRRCLAAAEYSRMQAHNGDFLDTIYHGTMTFVLGIGFFGRLTHYEMSNL